MIRATKEIKQDDVIEVMKKDHGHDRTSHSRLGLSEGLCELHDEEATMQRSKGRVSVLSR